MPPRAPRTVVAVHYVVNAYDARNAHVESQRLAKLTVRVLSASVRVQRGRPPVLTLRREIVRRCTNRYRADVIFRVPPHIVTVRVDTDWNVEFERLSALRETRRQFGHLLIDDPLGEHVVANHDWIDIIPPQKSASRRRGPTMKVKTEPLAGGSESGVVVQIRMVHDVGTQSAFAFRHVLAMCYSPCL